MSKLLQCAFVAFLGWQAYQYYQANSWPSADEASVLVYGRTSCGFTKQAISKLESAGVPYRFLSVDDRDDADVLHTRMREQSISTRRYLLPMIETNGRLAERPNLGEVVERYQSFAAKLGTSS